MGLRRALDVLPDDRATVSAARQLLAFLESHANESLGIDRIMRATNLPHDRVETIMGLFVETFVVDCAGSSHAWIYQPTSLLTLEVKRYLRSSSTSESKLQAGTERFRSRYGTTR